MAVLKRKKQDGTFEEVGSGVYSVNGQSGAVTLTAVDLNAITNPQNKSSGQLLKYDGTNWVASNFSLTRVTNETLVFVDGSSRVTGESLVIL